MFRQGLNSVSVLLALAVLAVGSKQVEAAGQIFPVPTITIYPGDRITDDLLVDKTIRSRRILRRPAMRNRRDMVGKVARRTLLRGYPVPLNSLRKPDAVSRGKPVRVIFQSGGLTISSQAMPLQSGAVGDVVSFRNLDSGSIVTGRIRANGTIQVGGS